MTQKLKQATLEEFDEKVKQGIEKAFTVAEGNSDLIETIAYLEKTWKYLYTGLLDVGILIHSMNFRTDEEIVDTLKLLKSKVKCATITDKIG